MDQQQFDAFARRLGTAVSRRTALRASVAALVPLAFSTGSPEAAKKCGPCEKPTGRRKKCKPVEDNKRCNGNGRCRRGACKRPPRCTGSGKDCTDGFECCSSRCVSDPGFCAIGEMGSPCHVDFDCGGGPSNNFRYRCIGYRCKDTLA